MINVDFAGRSHRNVGSQKSCNDSSGIAKGEDRAEEVAKRNGNFLAHY